jgi:hypothetical protein
MASDRKAGDGTSLRLFRGKYAPEQFIVPGQDQNGNSMRVWCRVVPLLDRAMDVLFSSHKFPFKSKGDLMRWCIKVGVERLEDMEPCVGSVLAQVDAMLLALKDEQMQHSFISIFNTMAETIVMRSHIERMNDGYWRSRYLAEMETKFGHLMKSSNVRGAGLGDHMDSGPDDSAEED